MSATLRQRIDLLPASQSWYARMARRECRGLPAALWTDAVLANVPVVFLARLAQAMLSADPRPAARRLEWYAAQVGDDTARSVGNRVWSIVGAVSVAA